MSRIKRALGSVAVGIVIIIATLVVLEGGASLLLFAREYAGAGVPASALRPHTLPDSLLGWINRPNFSAPNRYGREVGFSTTAQRFRGTRPFDPGAPVHLICSGDSYTSGEGVDNEHHWCALLETQFRGLQTFDMAEGAYGLDQTYLWYMRDGLAVPHQVHIVAVTAGQLERAMKDEVNGRYKPHLTVENRRLVTHDVPVPAQNMDALERKSAARAVDDLRIVQVVRMMPAFDERRRISERIDSEWGVFDAMLNGMADADRQAGVQLVLAYLPSLSDVRPGRLDTRRARLAAFAKERSIAYVDLTPALRTLRKDSLDLVFLSRLLRNVPSDLVGQYSNLGHAWVSRGLASRLDSLPALATLRLH